MTRYARDYMQPDVLKVAPDTPLLQVYRLFIEAEINGVPVVDDNDTVVGVISSLDLLRVADAEYEPGTGGTAPMYFASEAQRPFAGTEWVGVPRELEDRMGQLTAADAMVGDIAFVAPSATLAEVARVMRDRHIHRVLVMEDQQLEGILTTFDLLRALEEEAEEEAEPAQASQATGPSAAG